MVNYLKLYTAAPPLQWSWITLYGPDAKDFLHRLTTAQVKALAPGKGVPACFLTPLGKIRAFFTLWNSAPLEYGFEFDSGASGQWKSALLTVIDQYTFGEKITLSDPIEKTDLSCAWLFLDAKDEETLGLPPLKSGETALDDNLMRFCHHGNQDYGRNWISVWAPRAALTQWIDHHLVQIHGATEIPFDDVEKNRIQALRPRIDVEITPDSNPLEMGLLEAIAQNKGCYPGQEVIEKIISLGSPAFRLVQIKGQGQHPEAGDTLLNEATPPAEIGKVTSVFGDSHEFIALGLVRKIHAKENLPVQFAQKGSVREGVRGILLKVAPYVTENPE